MRIIFAGTPPFAAAHLEALLTQSEHKLVAVYTQPDRRSGRGKKLHASPVKQVAEQANIPVYQPLTLRNPDEQKILGELNADVMIVAAYGLILPEAVLNLPRLGCINIHASLLPRWRGAAPIERAIIAGDKETGITIMQMDIGLDTGDMLLKESCAIAPRETGDSLREKMITLGKPLLIKAISALADNTLTAEKQDDSQSNYASKIEKHEAQINWADTADLIDAAIRAFTSALACHTFLNEKRIRIVDAAAINKTGKQIASADAGTIVEVNKNAIAVRCNNVNDSSGNNCLEITKVQMPGSKAMDIGALLNGRPEFFKPGDCFSATDTRD